MNKQTGYTLIELLIGLLLGVFLMAGAIGIMNNLARSYALRDSMSRMQEDARYAIEVLSRELRHAGFMAFPRTDTQDGVFASQTATLGGLNMTVPVGAMIYGGGGLPDWLVVRYQASEDKDLEESLCFGGSTAASSLSPLIGDYLAPKVNAVVTERFYVEGNALKCDSRLDYYDPATGTSHFQEKNANTLIENVETLRVLYGVNTDTTTPESYLPNKYVDAAVVAAATTASPAVGDGGWKDVRSVRISLLLRSNSDSFSDAVTTSVAINGGKVVNIANTDQKRLYREFTTTVMLRNAALNGS